MVPSPSSVKTEAQQPLDAVPALSGYVRGCLLGIGLGLTFIFGIAWYLKPYDGQGQAYSMATHQQLGLPECTFKRFSGLPCPSCGMSTSFALLVRGDLVNSLKANAVGTLLAALCMAIVPWSLACAVCNRPILVYSMEKALMRIIIVFLALMLVRWVLVLGLIGWERMTP
jgi:hypothetical protein